MVFLASSRGYWNQRSGNWRDKTITAPRNCFYETGILGRVAKDLPQSHYCIVQPVVKIDESIALPETIAQFVPRNDFARFFQKHDKNLKRLFWKLKTKTLLA